MAVELATARMMRCSSGCRRARTRMLTSSRSAAATDQLQSCHSGIAGSTPASARPFSSAGESCRARARRRLCQRGSSGATVLRSPRGRELLSSAAERLLRADEGNQLAAMAAIHREVAVKCEQFTGIDQFAEPD